MENKIEQPVDEINDGSNVKIEGTFKTNNEKENASCASDLSKEEIDITEQIAEEFAKGLVASEKEKMANGKSEKSPSSALGENSLSASSYLDDSQIEDYKRRVQVKVEDVFRDINNFHSAEDNFKNNTQDFYKKSDLTTHQGSIAGKFKDAKTLLEAYNNLQAEFTRKSQKLAKVTSELEEYKNASISLNDNKNANENKNSNISTNIDLTASENSDLNSDVNQKLASNELQSRKSVNENYKKGLTEIVEKNFASLPQTSQLNSNSQMLAESEIASKLNDPIFLDKYILNNESVKAKVIYEYLSNLNKSPQAPSIMSGVSPSVVFTPASGAPKTVREAGELFSKMLK